jgi:hypothetical protein
MGPVHKSTGPSTRKPQQTNGPVRRVLPREWRNPVADRFARECPPGRGGQGGCEAPLFELAQPKAHRAYPDELEGRSTTVAAWCSMTNGPRRNGDASGWAAAWPPVAGGRGWAGGRVAMRGPARPLGDRRPRRALRAARRGAAQRPERRRPLISNGGIRQCSRAARGRWLVVLDAVIAWTRQLSDQP